MLSTFLIYINKIVYVVLAILFPSLLYMVLSTYVSALLSLLLTFVQA
jgi:hypothetical protein